MDKIILNTTDAPSPIGPYSQAVMVGNLLFISGQVAINPSTGNVDAKDVIEETHQVMHNLKVILAEAGIDFHSVVKTKGLNLGLIAITAFAEKENRNSFVFTSFALCN